MDNTSYQQQANELSKQLWAIANDLRGNMDLRYVQFLWEIL